MSSQAATIAVGELDRILRTRALRSMFQPIVNLTTGATIGYEALIRGPEGSPLASAGSLLEAAYVAGRVVELDWVARATACRAALAAGLDPEQLLFLNVEPLALETTCPADLVPDIERAFRTFRVVLEVTERSLDHDPALLLDGLDRMRPTVVGFALDDIGASAPTLSMLPLIAPAVLKLDRRIIQDHLNDEAVHVLAVAYEEAERTGATLLFEGIETAEHAALGRSLGATLGQGYSVGQPAWQPVPGRGRAEPMMLHAKAPASVTSPFDALRGKVDGRAPIELLTKLSRQVESSASSAMQPALLICLLPSPELFGPDLRRRFIDLSEQGVLTAVLGPGIPAEPGGGIRGTGLRGDPDITDEWSTVVLSPSSAAALLARADDVNHPDEFHFGMTNDAQRVIAAARSLSRRLGRPEPRPGRRPS